VGGGGGARAVLPGAAAALVVVVGGVTPGCVSAAPRGGARAGSERLAPPYPHGTGQHPPLETFSPPSYPMVKP